MELFMNRDAAPSKPPGSRSRRCREENVDVARQLIQAFNRRDLAAMTERFAPEVESDAWRPRRSGTRRLPRPR